MRMVRIFLINLAAPTAYPTLSPGTEKRLVSELSNITLPALMASVFDMTWRVV